jgi:primosomal protein N' (replication factor Y)
MSDQPELSCASAQAGCRIRVAVEAPQHTGLGAPLDYLAEQAWPPGTLVRVPLGRRTVTGIVWDPADEVVEPVDGRVLRPVSQALAALPPLPAVWRALVTFAAAYYQRGLGELALSVLPPELRKLDNTRLARRVKRLQAGRAPRLLQPLRRPARPPPRT